MENFSNDPVENFLINCLEYDPHAPRRWYVNKFGALYYFLDKKTWEMHLRKDCFDATLVEFCDIEYIKNADEFDYHYSKIFNFTDGGAKEHIIYFISVDFPDLERELLRAKQEETLTAPRPFEAL